jgi:hypothetical protein
MLSPARRCDQLQLHVPCVAERDIGDEVGGVAAVGAEVRAEVHPRLPRPSLDVLDAEQFAQAASVTSSPPVTQVSRTGVRAAELIAWKNTRPDWNVF